MKSYSIYIFVSSFFNSTFTGFIQAVSHTELHLSVLNRPQDWVPPGLAHTRVFSRRALRGGEAGALLLPYAFPSHTCTRLHWARIQGNRPGCAHAQPQKITPSCFPRGCIPHTGVIRVPTPHSPSRAACSPFSWSYSEGRAARFSFVGHCPCCGCSY